MGLVFSWPSQRLEQAFGAIDTLPSTPQSCSPDRLKLITTLVEEKNIPEDKLWLSSGICAFLYLYTSIHGYAYLFKLLHSIISTIFRAQNYGDFSSLKVQTFSSGYYFWASFRLWFRVISLLLCLACSSFSFTHKLNSNWWWKKWLANLNGE